MNRYEGIDKRIVLNVKVYAKHLKRHMAFRSMDIEDLEQDLMCKIFACIDRFDERCGELEHFVRKVLSRCCATLIETYTRKKRDSGIKFLEYSDELRNENADDYFEHERTILRKRKEVQRLVDEMPIKYRLMCTLSKDHNLAEIARIMGLSRSSVHRDLKSICFLFRHCENSKNNFLCLVRRGAENMSKNLSVIETMNVKELSQLRIHDLADLHEQVSKLINHAKELKEKFEDALHLRFSEAVQNNLRSENKDTGTTKFLENGFQITAEVPKKVTWDSKKISEIIKNIPEEKCKAIIKTTHVIDERKYEQLLPEDKNLFADARTVTPGKTRFQISIPEDQRDVGSVNF